MNRKLGEEAFAFYASLGTARSYERVAEQFSVSKRGVVKCAQREDWPARVAEIDRKARLRLEEQAIESLEEMSARHLKLARVIQGKALEALKSMPLNSAMNAVRALSLAIEIERGTRGEPGERDGALVAQVTRQEIHRLLKPAPESNAKGGENAGGDGNDW